jgi:hypothetical protein
MPHGPNVTRHGRDERVGDDRVGVILERELGDVAIVLHDLRVPGSRANIDHVVVAPSGVWVVDSEWRRELQPDLDSRESATSVDAVGRHVDVVADAVRDRATELPIRALSPSTATTGVAIRAHSGSRRLVTHPADLVARIREEGPLDVETMGWIAARLALGS